MAGPSTDPPSLANFDEYHAQLQGSALKATRNAVALPNDLGFYRSMDKGLAKEVDNCSSRVLSLVNRLLDLVSTGDTTVSRSKGKAPLEHDDVIDSFRSSVVDPMDRLLERADICLDDFMGLTKAPAIAVNPQPVKQKTMKQSNSTPGRLDPALQHASHLAKPQLKFKRKVNNDDSVPWGPTLKHKYNAQVPLGQELHDQDIDMDQNSLPHPYRYEIKNISYPSNLFTYAEPIPPKSFEDTPFKYVESPTDLAAMLDELRGAKEIAVDLEYHSYRSFAGFVCLMQASTRTSDWVVDTLALREELEELNEVFTDPSIVKVFHGAESDIVWLQQDFNLYIVNLFDTYHASKVLDFPRHSLATLMEMYCDFTPDKRYQLADWRIRPLPEEMLTYARSDTHFLLFIYDNLRNALVDRAQSRAASRAQSPSDPSASTSASGEPSHALVREVLSRSEETALRVYECEVYDAEGGSGPGGWDTLARKWNKGLLMAAERDSARRRVYRAIHLWRDRVAREEDESTRYVLPNHQLFLLAEQPPSDIAGLLGMFQRVSAIIRRRAKELLDTIREAAKEVAIVEEVATVEDSAPTEPVDEVMAVVESEVKENLPQDAPPLHEQQLWPSGECELIDFGENKMRLITCFGASVSAPKRAKISSSLFRDSLDVVKGGNSPRKLFMASHSTLFSDRGLTQTTVDVHKQRVRDIVARIHGELVIAPSAPSLPLNATSEIQTTIEAKSEAGITGQVEMAFVPAHEREGKRLVTTVTAEKDTIVIVGQPQRKKRKRDKKTAQTSDTAHAKLESEEAADTTAFDYSTVPNILDDGSDHEPDANAGGPRKRKQKQRGGQGPPDTTGFRAPPKAPAEVRRGNQSRTFR
ncbi:hypothetical protein BDY19DRAFT_1007236 [Irpex rosettiformis]|uniref:Uncharacterized protein n=1 Tax=Irpex rosettiformis TaxID=378272 RepID=A0ACB8U312_9APHY|nr:hypothetical protein BDY19DRAFT_1007236 [Irpex rosettiformis]